MDEAPASTNNLAATNTIYLVRTTCPYMHEAPASLYGLLCVCAHTHTQHTLAQYSARLPNNSSSMGRLKCVKSDTSQYKTRALIFMIILIKTLGSYYN